MKNLILPAFVILIGAGSAFATQNAKKDASKLVDRPGYIYNHALQECEEANMCSNTVSDEVCTIDDTPSGQQVYGLNSPDDLSTCNTVLFKKSN